MQPISKSTFLQYQICPKDTWLKLHKPDLVESFSLTEFERHLLEQGNEVEVEARQLFLGAVLVSATGDEAVEETRRLMVDGTEVIFQATFLADGFFAKCDVLKRGALPGAMGQGAPVRRRRNPDNSSATPLTAACSSI